MRMTIADVNMECEAYNNRLKRQAEEMLYNAWVVGQYTASAIMCTIGNSGLFHKKGAKPHEYPPNPLLELKGTDNKGEITEDEKQRQLDLFIAKMETISANWENQHKDDNKDNNEGVE